MPRLKKVRKAAIKRESIKKLVRSLPDPLAWTFSDPWGSSRIFEAGPQDHHDSATEATGLSVPEPDVEFPEGTIGPDAPIEMGENSPPPGKQDCERIAGHFDLDVSAVPDQNVALAGPIYSDVRGCRVTEFPAVNLQTNDYENYQKAKKKLRRDDITQIFPQVITERECNDDTVMFDASDSIADTVLRESNGMFNINILIRSID